MENKKYPNPSLETAYWYHKLEKFIVTNNKPLAYALDLKDEWLPFLQQRSRAAADEYLNAMEAGASEQGAKEIANAILFLNVNFDAQEIIEEQLVEHFPYYYEIMRKTDSLQFWLECIQISLKDVFIKIAKENSEQDIDGQQPELMSHIADYLATHRDDIDFLES